MNCCDANNSTPLRLDFLFYYNFHFHWLVLCDVVCWWYLCMSFNFKAQKAMKKNRKLRDMMVHEVHVIVKFHAERGKNHKNEFFSSIVDCSLSSTHENWEIFLLSRKCLFILNSFAWIDFYMTRVKFFSMDHKINIEKRVKLSWTFLANDGLIAIDIVAHLSSSKDKFEIISELDSSRIHYWRRSWTKTLSEQCEKCVTRIGVSKRVWRNNKNIFTFKMYRRLFH